MKNIQMIDGADNATYSIFKASDEEFEAIFPNGQDMELIEDVFERLGEKGANSILKPIWGRPILKREALGIHGTLFFDNERRRDRIPPSKREVDWPASSITQAQRELFARYR